MRATRTLQTISGIVLLAMLVVTIIGIHDCAHSMGHHELSLPDSTAQSVLSAAHDCPCTPQDQHRDHDDCDTCINCACHAPLAAEPFKLGYIPTICRLTFSAPFQSLPDVYLPKFIPPQNPL